MKSIFALLIAVLIAGCSTSAPVKRNFPDAPQTLKEHCEKLKTIEGDKVAITDMLRVVVENYRLHYECANKVEGWNDWYTEQKKIFESVK